ncbi:hypothetical protein PRIPAC_86776 [Pristionchus pacificus]|nr:hypothetical protein PRIPAC_86776 [Pristionchus pacificus]
MVKVATKGQQQIADENKETIQQFGIATVMVGGLYFVLGMTYFNMEGWAWWGWAISFIIQVASLLVMRAVSKSKTDAKGHVVDAGLDLNDSSAIGEPCKDLIILATISQFLGLFTNYGFLALLAAPSYGIYKALAGFIIPWFTASPPQDEEKDEREDKKARKMERRMKRMQ